MLLHLGSQVLFKSVEERERARQKQIDGSHRNMGASRRTVFNGKDGRGETLTAAALCDSFPGCEEDSTDAMFERPSPQVLTPLSGSPGTATRTRSTSV